MVGVERSLSQRWTDDVAGRVAPTLVEIRRAVGRQCGSYHPAIHHLTCQVTHQPTPQSLISTTPTAADVIMCNAVITY